MLVDSGLTFDSSDLGENARRLESIGYDGAWAAEAGHDPFLTLSAVADSTSRIELGTGIAVAFGRSPMITAVMANDLQLLSRGRLLLGLGSQIKPHIEKRYSMPWSHPARRMREYVLALRAIWSNWHEDTALDFRGEFYQHTLMTPFFSPGPSPFGSPKVFLAAVGEQMTEVAGEVADGLIAHPFTTEKYLREVTLPALSRGFARSGRSKEDFQISLSGMVVVEDEHRESDRDTFGSDARRQLAFYGSTPAYRGVLDLHGLGDVQPKLNALSRNGKWAEMADLVSDEMLDLFTVIGPLDQLANLVDERFGDIIERFSVYPMASVGQAVSDEMLRGLKSRANDQRMSEPTKK